MKLTIKQKMLLAAGALVSGSAMADVSAAATAFSTQWATDVALVGGAMITGAFLALGYKWVKGMIFS
ncbi:major capsid protein [Rheinheimera pleomorphica]|uniref:major capsid protein n=1 Tax=Rheinheimera pleomorphica TaxID=2703963 RepID=UPI0014236031|nr:major capsid protein [Rheinheimera pleomorphica]